MPWILQRQEKGCYRNLTNLIQTDIPGYQNFVRIPAADFDLIQECIHHRIKKEVTNFRKPLEVGLNLAITLRHLATGEIYISLEYHWLVGQNIMYKFILNVCWTILDEFQKEYLSCPTTPEDWKQVEGKFRTRWNIPHALVALDETHIALKKPKKSGSE